MNIVCILGRQPELSLAELELRFGAAQVTGFNDDSAIVQSDELDVQTLGGVQKAGAIIAELERADWARLSRDVVQRYTRHLQGDAKLTIGISVYGLDVAARDVQRTGIALKQALKRAGRSVRLVPNESAVLSTATSHHNKLGLSASKVELMIVYGDRSVLIAESIGAQNITALANRDQNRPKRDAYVGMLPPKLALMMINMTGTLPPGRILDPFCGTGVVLQEAALRGYDVYGTDLSEKMVDYSTANLEWLAHKHRLGNVSVQAGDATTHTWTAPISAVVAETYLGQPFSAPPAADKLEAVVRTVDAITMKFLQNCSEQLKPGTPLCLAVPAWRSATGWFTFLPVLKKIESLGYEWRRLERVDVTKLTYFRPDQVVARQLLILTKR